MTNQLNKLYTASIRMITRVNQEFNNKLIVCILTKTYIMNLTTLLTWQYVTKDKFWTKYNIHHYVCNQLNRLKALLGESGAIPFTRFLNQPQGVMSADKFCCIAKKFETDQDSWEACSFKRVSVTSYLHYINFISFMSYLLTSKLAFNFFLFWG